MRCAVVLALGDPRSSDAGMWIDAVAWLRQEFADMGFHVVVIDGDDVEGDLARALEGLTPHDELLLHISGRLVDRGVVCTAGGRWVRMQTLGDMLAAYKGASLSVFAELIHNDGPSRSAGGEHVAAIIGDLGARARGFAVMAGVRTTPASVEGLALTRLCIDAARTADHAGALVSWEVYQGAVRVPESLACAQSFRFVRAADDGTSAAPPRRGQYQDDGTSAAPPRRGQYQDDGTSVPPPWTPVPREVSEPLPSFALDAPPLGELGPLPSFALDSPSHAEGEPLPSFALDDAASATTPLGGRFPEALLAPAPLPSFELVSSSDAAPLPSFALESDASPAAPPFPSFDSEPLPSFESVPSALLPLPPPPAPRTLDERIADATDRAQWALVVELRRERLHDLNSVRLRVRELVAIARVLQVELDDAEGALGALDEARHVDPMRVGVLQALRRGYERLGRWEQAFDAIGALADASASPTDRAELHFAQARMALDQLRDQERALTVLQTALQNDPAHDRALALFDEVCAARATDVGRPPHQPEPDDSPDAGAKSAPESVELRTDPSAMAPDGAMEAAASEPSGDRVAEGEAPEIEPVPDDFDEEAEEAAIFDATDPSNHASAFEVHRREGRTDAALLAALALEELGAADVDQQVLVDQFRSVAPIRARGTLDGGAWELLRMDTSSEALTTLFAAVSRAAVTTRLEQLVARKRLVSLDPAKRLDETSTASIVRSFQWAARVLGVPCPALYVVDEVPGDIAAVRAREPSTALGPSVLRGRSAKELAFLAGRHLTYYLPEHQVLVYFPTGEDLERLLMATIGLVAPETLRGAENRNVTTLRGRLERHISKAELSLIAAASPHLARGVDLATWARSVELSAGRAGLLLCGDLATATALVRSESRPIAGLTPQDRRYDMIAFCSSPEHSELRSRFFVTAPESVQPPPGPMRPRSELESSPSHSP